MVRVLVTSGLLAGTGLAALATVVIMLLPNSVEVGPSGAVFFDCGSALSPTREPAQEPGISACKKANSQMRTAAVVSAAAAVGMGALGAVLLFSARRPKCQVEHLGSRSDPDS